MSDNLYIIFYSLLATPVITLISELVREHVKNFIYFFKEYLKQFSAKKKKYEINMEYEKYLNLSGSGSGVVEINSENKHIISHILKNCDETSGDVIIKNNKIVPLPIKKFNVTEDIEGILFRTLFDKCEKLRLCLSSDTVNVKDYVQKLCDDLKTMFNFDKNIYFLDLHIKDEQRISFKKYDFKSEKTFDKMYINEDIKKSVINLLNKNQKTSFLLHGLPGCGKTSLIKSIANYTGRSIFNIDLSKLQTYEQLFEILFLEHKSVYCDQYSVFQSDIPFEKSIFIFEDVDAEEEEIKINRDKPDASKKCEDKKEKFLNNKKSLKSLLNIFDGVLELKNIIIIFTTNYVKKLDPALIRPGRIDINIELGKLSSELAEKMIFDRFKEKVYVQSEKYTPAELEVFLNTSSNVTELKKKLK